MKNGKHIYEPFQNNHMQKLKLMTHAVIGYPTLAKTRELIKVMAASDVDYIELQIPFSDPLGDGPVIRRANTVALQQKTRVEDAFILVTQLRTEDKIATPFFFMTYFNIIFSYDPEKFCARAASCGVQGLIVPDYNPDLDTREKLQSTAKKFGLILVSFLGPNSSPKKINDCSKNAEGFIYCFANQGITGTKNTALESARHYLLKIKKHVAIPLAVGFGISTVEDIRALQGAADIVIIGSELIRVFDKSGIEGVKIKLTELISALEFE